MLILVALTFVNCNDSSSHTHSTEQLSIELNHGEKWKVNSEMITPILTSEKILDEYNGENYHELALRLKNENEKLIQSCTMEGKSHEELHKWLHPHIQLIETLSKADNHQQAGEIIAQLEKSYQTYHGHFQ